MTTNREWLYSLDVADLSDWFDAEHVDNTKSAKRAAAVERLRDYESWADGVDNCSLLKAVIGIDSWGIKWKENRDALIDLLTDDGGLTNLEWLFIDSEQFRQAVSAFAFAHSDDCPTSPTQMVDWLMAEHVDAHSKLHSKTEQMLTEQSESLSDANDDLAPESDVRADAVDANDENATNRPIGESVALKTAETAENATAKCDMRDFGDSREKLEADVRQYANPSGGTGTLGACWEKKMLEFLDRQDEITRDETIRTYNIAAREARKVQEKRIAELQARVDELQADNDELRKRFSEIAELNGYAWQEGFEKGCESRDDAIADWRAENDRLHDELAKRDKGIARLKRQRDTARAKIDELEAECETCCYKTDYIEMDFYDVDRLEAERDALAHDLQDCEQQRERLRQALGCAIDHAHEIMALVDIEGEVA